MGCVCVCVCVCVYIHINNGIPLSHKKDDIFLFEAKWMSTDIMLNEMSDGERQMLYDFMHMWNIKLFCLN